MEAAVDKNRMVWGDNVKNVSRPELVNLCDLCWTVYTVVSDGIKRKATKAVK